MITITVTLTEVEAGVVKQALSEYLSARKCHADGTDFENGDGLDLYVANRYRDHLDSFRIFKRKELWGRINAAISALRAVREA